MASGMPQVSWSWHSGSKEMGQLESHRAPQPAFPLPPVSGRGPQVLQLRLYHRLCLRGCAEAGGLWVPEVLQGQVGGLGGKADPDHGW